MTKHQDLEPFGYVPGIDEEDIKCRYDSHRGGCGPVTYSQEYGTNRGKRRNYFCDLHAFPPSDKISFSEIQDRSTWATSSVNIPLMGLKRNLELYNMDMNPDYQRGYVWTQRQKELFVGHLLEGGKVPSIIINDPGFGNEDVYELIDGKQRIQACVDWLDGKVKAELSAEHNFRKISLDDLDYPPGMMCGLVFDFVKLDREGVLKLYLKLNRGGTIHTDKEIDKVKKLLDKELSRKVVK